VRVDAPDAPYAVGGIYQQIQGLMDISVPYRSVLVRIGWTRDGKMLHPASMIVRGSMVECGLARFRDVLVAPEGANGARLTLDLKWPQGGFITWKKASIRQTALPLPRRAKVGTVFLRFSNSTIENNLKLFCEQIDAAGKLGLDIVCLGEAITMVGTASTIQDYAEPIPGPSTKQLGDASRRNNIWVVAGLTERDGNKVYNTAVLLDREGKLVGKYRKVHLPREEWIQGVTPGDEYPVFHTDFGIVAIQICYDWFFPEPETIFALKGAEIIFAPTWGNTLPDHDGMADGETVFRVRARDNGVYMVLSVYDGNSLVIDPMGRILASSNGKEGVFWAEIDLNNREQLDWVGYWRSIGPRHRMTHTYAPLLIDPQKPTY